MIKPCDIQIHETVAGLEISLHVQPRAKRTEISGVHNGALKVKVTAPPVDDAANHSIIGFFSKRLGVSKSSLQITSGLKSRDKDLRIKGLSLPAFIDRINE